MKKISLKLTYKILLATCLITTFSCKKVFDVKPEDQVDVTNNYRDVYDANAAVIGIYGKFMGIADRYIVLNELRADLMSPTANADQYLRQLNEHAVTTDNPWADPRPFYNIILNCNDAMAHFDTMVAENKLTQADYQQRYSDIGAIRSFIYLQLAIQYGAIPYVTDPVANASDLNDATKFPRLTLDQVLDKLIAFMSDGKRYLDTYPTTATITGATNTSLNTTVDGYSLSQAFINKRVLLGDLYLWKGNYTQAAANYRYVSDTGYREEQGGGNRSFWQYKAPYATQTFAVQYTNAQDERTLINNSTNGWQAIFSNPTPGTETSTEWIWTMPFDSKFQPIDPFINLFSNQGGSYLLTASKLALDNWNSQTQNNGLPYDVRGRLSVKTINGQPVIMKPLYYYLDFNSLVPMNIFQKQGRWLIQRGGTMLLHFAEAAVNDGQVKVGYALTNVGVNTVFNGIWPGAGTLPADRTNIQQTKAPAPYDLDARNGDSPNYRAPWYRSVGTRSRANLPQLNPNLTTDALGMENAIVDELGLETAFEGNRWSDLVRVALRRKNPAFLADKVYQKLFREGNPNAAIVQQKLMTPANWFLPFKL